MNKVLKIVADNANLTEALKELFLKQFEEKHDTTKLNNESLGQITRSRLDGIAGVNNAFKEIEILKTVKEKPEPPMQGR